MKQFLSAPAAVSTLGFASLAFAATYEVISTTATVPAYSTAESTIGELLDNKATLAILEKHLPAIVQSDQIDMARSMTLRQIQSYAPDDVTDVKLVLVDADLAALPKQ